MATYNDSGANNDGRRIFRIGRIGGDKQGDVALLELIREIPDNPGPGRKFDTRRTADGEKTWHFEVFRALDGYVSDVYTTVREIAGKTQKILCLELADGIDKYLVEVGDFDGRYSLNLLARLANPHFDKNLKLRISPYAFTDKDGKQRIGVGCHNGADKLETRKDNPHANDGYAPPAPTYTEFKGQKLWDWTPVADYLYQYVTDKVFAHGKDAEALKVPTAAQKHVEGPVNDDLPF